MRQPLAVVAIGGTALGVIAAVAISIHVHRADHPVNHAVTGELVAYQALSRELTLRTNDGNRHFVVQTGTPVHEGAQTITLAALVSARGCRAKVWCIDEKGRSTVSEIRISCNAIERDPVSQRR
jgi:hypothetical protein